MPDLLHTVFHSPSISTSFAIKTLLLIHITLAVRAKADHGQWDCQVNEIYIECGSCEASCKIPLIKNCSKACRPPRCECQSHNGFVRAHDGACIHVSECQTYTLMSQLYPGHHIPLDHQHNFVEKATTKVSHKKHRKTTKPHVHFDPTPTEVTPSNTDYGEEAETTDPTFETTTSPSESISSSNEEETNGNNSPPSIAPFDYGGAKKIINQAKPSKSASPSKPSPPFKPNHQHHVLDRDSALVGAKHQNTRLVTNSSPGQVPPTRSHPFGLNGENEEEQGKEGGYGLQSGHGHQEGGLQSELQPPPHNNQQQTYGARPVLRGEVGDKYEPKKPGSNGAPAFNPTPPGTPPYRYAYAPASPPLQQDDSHYALYPPQKYRIYRRKRDGTLVGPPRQ